jgi:hypothetical protein
VIAVVLVSEAEQTERLITLLIAVLLGVAVLLMGLTFWYWRHTSPRRYARQLFPEPRGADLDLRQRYAGGGYNPALEGGGRILPDAHDAYDVYDPRRDHRQPAYDSPEYGDPRHDPYADPYHGPRQGGYEDQYRQARRR